MPGEAVMPRRLPYAFWALWVTLALAAPLILAGTAHAQDATDERRCTGQWRATNAERIASCTALIDSGHYQPANLAILHHDRGMAMRANGDLAGALNDFAAAIALNPDYARAFADRGSVRLAQHDLDGAIADLDAAIKLNGTDAGAFMTRGNAFDEKATSTAPSPTTTRRSDFPRITPRPTSIAASRSAARAISSAIADYDQAIKLDPKIRRRASTTAASSGSRRAISTGPSPITIRRSGSTPISPLPTTTAATSGAPRGDFVRAPPTSTAPSSFHRSSRWPTTIAASSLSEKGLRPRHRRFQYCDPLDPTNAGLQQPRQRLRRQGRPQLRHCRL
jgi:tetratricopeptide (TPR) repeat protein